MQQERHAKNHWGRNRRDVGLKYEGGGGASIADAESAGSGRVSAPMCGEKTKLQALTRAVST
jgi:hypothetical protein